jgi:hypothetical protein
MNAADPRLIAAIILDLFGWIFLVIDSPVLAGILFVLGSILALYSLLDWLAADINALHGNGRIDRHPGRPHGAGTPLVRRWGEKSSPDQGV